MAPGVTFILLTGFKGWGPWLGAQVWNLCPAGTYRFSAPVRPHAPPEQHAMGRVVMSSPLAVTLYYKSALQKSRESRIFVVQQKIWSIIQEHTVCLA